MTFAILAIGCIALMSVLDCLFEVQERSHRPVRTLSDRSFRARWRR